MKYSEQGIEGEEKVTEPFDESKAFDPELMQPKFGVSAIVEPEVSMKVAQHIDKVNSSNKSIETKGNLVPSFDLADIIRKKKENCNIDFKDEISKYNYCYHLPPAFCPALPQTNPPHSVLPVCGTTCISFHPPPFHITHSCTSNKITTDRIVIPDNRPEIL